MARLVIADASPLIALAKIDGLVWLEQLFGEVWIPRQVLVEVLPHQGFPEEAIIQAALTDGWLRVPDSIPVMPQLPDLDEGESACIRFALAQTSPSLVLIDERAGRAVAQELGLRVVGTAAIIGMAKSLGLVASAREVFARLLAADFRISAEVIRTVLGRVGE